MDIKSPSIQNNNGDGMDSFKPGSTYSTKFLDFSDSTLDVEIIQRTATHVWIKCPHKPGETTSREISMFDGDEGFFPFGHYSMAPYVSCLSLKE